MNRFLFILPLFLLPFIVSAQCNNYYVVEQGSAWTYETHDANGKRTGKNEQTVKAFEKRGNGFTATIASIAYNDKGKELTKGELKMRCDNGIISIDMRKFIPEEQLKALSSYDLKITGDNIETPSNLSVGQTLRDGTITVTVEGAPMPMKMTVSVTNRKVEGKETITTPAGTFECYKISSKTSTEMQMGMNMTFDFSGTEWITARTGMVKSESFDKNGKLTGYVVLTARK